MKNKSTYIIIFLTVLILSLRAQQTKIIDSLNQYINKAVNDTDRVNRIIKSYNDELWRYNTTLPYELLKEAMRISKKNNYEKGILKSLAGMIGYSRNNGNLQFASRFSREYLYLSAQSKDSLIIMKGIGNMGAQYRDEGKQDSSLLCLLQTKEFYERREGSKDLMARLYSQLSGTYGALQMDSLSIYYAKKSLALREEINYADGIDASLGQLAGIYLKQKKYDKVLEYVNTAYNNRIRANDSVRVGDYLSMIGYAKCMLGDCKKGISDQLKGLGMVNRNNTMYFRQRGGIYQRLYESFEKQNDYKNALYYFRLHRNFSDSILTLEKVRSMSNFQSLYGVEDKENQIRLLDSEKQIQEKDIKLQRFGLIIGTIILIAVLVTLLFIFKAYRQKRDANHRLAEQKRIIEEKQKEILDSINYAKKLQGAILLSEQDLAKHFTEIFVLYKPKDIVGGDFYWFSESEHNTIIAVADCTGHGVPGGFMSMLGYECLQDVALRKEILTTSQALSSLDKKITDSLNKSERTFRDGMDIALCAFSKEKEALQYSGANRPLIQITNGEIIEHKPNKQSIGGNIDGTEKNYDTKEIKYNSGDMLYLFTDGYADQFGGPKGKKFKYRQLIELLKINSHLKLNLQKELLDSAFESWKGQLEQVDDVCIIGIRL